MIERAKVRGLIGLEVFLSFYFWDFFFLGLVELVDYKVIFFVESWFLIEEF